MKKFLSSIVLLVLSLFAVNVSAQTVGETLLGSPRLVFEEAYAAQCTYVRFQYDNANEAQHTKRSRSGVKATLKLNGETLEEASFGFTFSPVAAYGFKFNTVLDRSKTYTIEIGEGCWWMENDKTGDSDEESPSKTVTIEATQGGGEQGGGEQGGGTQATPWDFTSVTPAAGKVASLNKITVKADGVDFTSVTGMTKGVIKCAETNAETNVFFMATWDGEGLEASFTKITADGTYTLTIAEGAVKVNGNPNNEYTATWTIGQVTPPAPTTTTLSLDATEKTLEIGDDFTLKATSNVQALISWESSDINVAVVNEQGRVTAKGAGTCTITASIPANDDHTAASATCAVTVNAPAQTGPFASITIGSDVIELSETTPIELYEYPEGAVIKINLSDENIKGAWYEIKDLTTNENYKSFADLTKGEGYYYAELARTYAMVAGHNYAIHAWFRNRASQMQGQELYSYNFLVKGTNNDVPVLSSVSEFESVSPTTDFVLTGVTGTNTIDVRFKGEAPASATAWATVGQGSRMNLQTSIVGNTVKVTVPNSAIAQGVLVLFVQAKDSEGHIIGGGGEPVNPDNGALNWSWLSEVGCEQPQMLEAGTTVDELKTVTFKASDILSLDEGQLITVAPGEYIRRYNQLQVMDKLGNVIVSSVEASQYEEVNNNIVLTLKNGIVEAGEYTIVLPYGAFLIGEEMQASSNASGTYVVTVSGNLEPQGDNILGEPVFTVTADKITISFPNAKIPAGITDGEISFPGGVIINTPDGTEETETYKYPDTVFLPTTDGISFTFNNPKGIGAIVTIPAEGIQVIDYTDDYFGKVIYTNSEALTNKTTSGINAVKAAAVNGAAFNIAGQKVNADAKGIIIVNGKKQINK